MALTKKITLDDDVKDVLQRSPIFHLDGTNEWILRLPEQLERSLYVRVMKVIDAEGGKWNRQAKGHVFRDDPRERLGLALERGELTIMKEGWFPTPPLIAEQMLQLAPWDHGEILEPSAGEGAIAERIIGHWPEAELYLLCIERNERRAAVLREKGFATIQADFLMCPLPAVFRRCYLNPPFEQAQDIDHVIRAFDLLMPQGELVAVMSEGTFFREDRKARDFRAILELHEWMDYPLAEGAFQESGTGVRTRLVHVRKE